MSKSRLKFLLLFSFILIHFPLSALPQPSWGSWQDLKLSSNGVWSAGVTDRGEVYLFETESGHVLAAYQEKGVHFRCVFVSDQGSIAAFGDQGKGFLYLKDEEIPLKPLKETVRDVTGTQSYFWTADDSGRLTKWSWKGEVQDSINVKTKAYILSISLSPNADYLGSCSEDGRLCIFDLKTKNQTASWIASKDWLSSILWTPEGILTLGDEGTLSFWNSDGTLINKLSFSSGLSVLALKEKKWVCGDRQGNLYCGSIEDWKASILIGKIHEGPISGVGWTEKGHIFTAGVDSRVQLWDFDSKKLLGILVP